MSDPRETLAALQDHVIDRRRFLAFTGALAGTALYAQVRGDAARARPLRGYPFRLGVASGDPEPTAVSLWTRLAPEPLVEGGGMPQRDVAVRWELSRDHRFKKVERRGVVAAVPELAHSVHVDVRGLDPGREYFYRFSTGPDRSPVGRTVTAPKPAAKLKELTFAFASCQAWPDGFYSAYRQMNEQDLDLVIHLGDYIYEYGNPADGGARNVAVPPALQEYCVTLERFRLQHSLYKTDPDLQEAHAASPGRHVGRPRGRERLRRDLPGVRGDLARVRGQARGRATRRTSSTCRCASRRGRRPASSSSTGGCATATSPSSTCSTRASTAPTSRAATASSRAARRASTPRRR